MLLFPDTWKFLDCERSIINAAGNRIKDDKLGAACAAPPARHGIVTGEFDRGLSALANHRPEFPLALANGLVSCHVVGDQSEERGQRLGATASLGPGKLPDSLGVATQTAAGYGEARTGSTLWEG